MISGDKAPAKLLPPPTGKNPARASGPPRISASLRGDTRRPRSARIHVTRSHLCAMRRPRGGRPRSDVHVSTGPLGHWRLYDAHEASGSPHTLCVASIGARDVVVFGSISTSTTYSAAGQLGHGNRRTGRLVGPGALGVMDWRWWRAGGVVAGESPPCAPAPSRSRARCGRPRHADRGRRRIGEAHARI